jgi:hypothetical protein
MKRKLWTLPALLALSGAVGCSQEPETVEVPEGTTMTLALETTVRSDMSRDGDIVVARIVEPLVVDGRTVIAEGASVYGELSAIEIGEGDDPAKMTLDFNEIEDAYGNRHDLEAEPFTLIAATVSDDLSGLDDDYGGLISSDDPNAAARDDVHKDDTWPDNTETADRVDEMNEPGKDQLDEAGKMDHDPFDHSVLRMDQVLKAEPGENEVIVPADGFHAIELPSGQQLVVRIEEGELPVLASAQ